MKLCEQCGEEHVKRIEAKYCSRLCFHTSTVGKMPKNLHTLHNTEINKRRSAKLIGSKSPHWRGDKVGYSGIHLWLMKSHTKKNVCELCNKTGRTDWALLKGKSYQRKRENFFELCKRCHINYDNIINKGWKTKRQS